MKSFIKPSLYKEMLITGILFVIFSACKKEMNKEQIGEKKLGIFADKTTKVNTKKIYVTNLNELYNAVNDVANAGSVILLAAGTYTLEPNYPNAGRLELQPDMMLQGQQGHADEVIIDASALPNNSFDVPFRTGAIRMGRGHNVIEWLKVKGNANALALSAIETDLVSTGISLVRVAHTIVTGSRIGIDVRNSGPASAGHIIDADIGDNELLENLVQVGQGIIIQNGNGCTGAIIRANLHGNNAHDNLVGMRAFTQNTNSGSITIRSTADRFDGNGIGIALYAGTCGVLSASSNDNVLRFDAFGTSIRNNLGTLPPDILDPASPGGIFAVGGNSNSITAVGPASNNKLEINLWGSFLSGNQVADINAFGAHTNSPVVAGANNFVEIHLRGISKKAKVKITPSFPVESVTTNNVKIFR